MREIANKQVNLVKYRFAVIISHRSISFCSKTIPLASNLPDDFIQFMSASVRLHFSYDSTIIQEALPYDVMLTCFPSSGEAASNYS